MSESSHWQGRRRLGGLRRFAFAITVLNVLGHTVLGFEQAPIVPFVALLAAYGAELVLELVDATLRRRPYRFAGGGGAFVDFLLSAHITGLATGMLLYTNDRLGPVVCAAVIAIASKSAIRSRIDGRECHLFNPSNFGITATLLAFPWVGIAPPYHFTENLYGVADWILPAVIVISGTLLNARFTQRLPLIAAWLSGFFVLALIRSLVSNPMLEFVQSTSAPTSPLAFLMFLRGVVQAAGSPAGWDIVAPALMPMTGVAFLLYTFYMVTDPATTPTDPRHQVIFGLSVAAIYSLLMTVHIVFGLFFALTIVSAGRGVALALTERSRRRRAETPAVLIPVSVDR
jgi:hypothetical protein